MDDGRLGKGAMEAVEHRDRRGAGRRGIVAAQHAGGIGQRPDHHDLRIGPQRQQPVILEQHHALRRRLQRQRAILRRADGVDGHHRELARGKAGQVAIAIAGREQPDQGAVEIGIGQQAPLERGHITIAQPLGFADRAGVAFIVDARAESRRHACGRIGGIFVMIGNIDHRIAV